MTAWFHQIPTGTELMFFGLANTAWTATTWWRDCIIEGDMGMHTEIVRKNMVSGMWLFIVSEAMLFFGLLWACLHLGMSPSVHVQMQWPPVGIEPIGWDKRALVMSAVLAASYYSANVAMVAKDPKVGGLRAAGRGVQCVAARVCGCMRVWVCVVCKVGWGVDKKWGRGDVWGSHA